MSSELEWLQGWYRAQCDGRWEHGYGVKIDTIDNPGWWVVVDLKGTILEHVAMPTLSTENGDGDWMRLEVKASQFVGHGDPTKLTAILAAFREWATERARERTP